MHTSERQEVIADHINRHGRVTVDALAAMMTVSRETIRRDLSALAGEGRIRKLHGGASPVEIRRVGRAREELFDARMRQNVPAKRRIARTAAGLFKSGDTLFVDTGSTTVLFSEELGRMSGLTVIANSCTIAHNVAVGDGNRVFLVGGEYRRNAAENLGRLALDQIRTFKAEHVVLTIGALDAEGIADFDLEETEVARAMVERGRRLTVLADGSKLERTAIFQVCGFERVERVVTDARPTGTIAAALEAAGVEVVLAV